MYCVICYNCYCLRAIRQINFIVKYVLPRNKVYTYMLYTDTQFMLLFFYLLWGIYSRLLKMYLVTQYELSIS